MNDPFLKRIAATLSDQALLEGVSDLRVGFSGGPDSTALLLALHHLRLDVRLSAVHLHHGLRGPDADADAAWCRGFCERLAIPFTMDRLDVPTHQQPGESIEMAARRLRLAWWQQHGGEEPGSAVALGHHRDDGVETLLMRLLRGANASGLTGLRHRRWLGGVCFVRPLLDVDRADLLIWLREQGVTDYRIDATNRDPEMLRNAVRQRLVPLISELAGGLQGLHHTLAWLEQDARLLEELTTGAMGADLDVATLRELPDALWPRALRAWRAQHGHGDEPVPAHLIEQLHLVLDQRLPDEPVQLDWDANYFLRLERGMLLLEARQPPCLAGAVRWHWREQPRLHLPELGVTLEARLVEGLPAACVDESRSWWPVDELPACLVVRQRLPGDRLVPYGMNQYVRMKKVLCHAKVTKTQKERLVVLCREDGEILWIPLVRRSAHTPVDPADAGCVELRYVSSSINLSSRDLPADGADRDE